MTPTPHTPPNQCLLEIGDPRCNPLSERAHEQIRSLADELGLEVKHTSLARTGKVQRKLPVGLLKAANRLSQGLSRFTPRFIARPCRQAANFFGEMPPPWFLVNLLHRDFFHQASAQLRGVLPAPLPGAIVVHVDSYETFLQALALIRQVKDDKCRIFLIMTGYDDYLAPGRVSFGALAYARYLVLRRNVTLFVPARDIETILDVLCFPAIALEGEDSVRNRVGAHFGAPFVLERGNSILFAYRGGSMSGRGAARYAELLCKCMEKHSYTVSMYVPDAFRDEKMTVCARYAPDDNAASFLLKALDRLESLYLSWRDFHLLHLYFSHAFNKKLRRTLAAQLKNHSLVAVCQQDWMLPFVSMGTSLGLPVLCCTVDLMGSRCLLPPVKNFFNEHEKRFLSKCDFVSTVEKGESEELAHLGVPNHLMPTSTAFGERHSVADTLEKITILYVAAKINFNRIGKRQVFRLARKALSAKKDWRFVIVGNCAEPAESTENITCTGYVPDETLAEMYRKATLVLAPVPYGTGSTNKVIEAFAFGCPVLGTEVVYRGLPVRHGVHCLIEDNMEKYFQAMEAAFQDADLLERLSVNAFELSRGYDFLEAFRPLGDFLDAASGQTGEPS